MAHPHPTPSSDPARRIIGRSPVVAALRDQIHRLAVFDTVGSPLVPTLLLQGETGTGKGLVARVLHECGPRADGPFIEVNCAAIPETLLEAELFGFEAGAFTDAKRPKPGLFEVASGGTLFLDEIDALPLGLQGKLLKAIEERRIRHVGGVADKPVDIKLTVAAHADLNARVAEGRFRADLYYRLAVVLLEVPPLREWGEDVLVLAEEFLRQYAAGYRLIPKHLSPAAVAWLRRYSWPGNVRELSHLMERVTLLHTDALVDAETLERLCLPRAQPVSHATVEPARDDRQPEDEASQIRQVLCWTEGNVAQAARSLGLSRKALRYRMQRYGIERPSQEAVVASPMVGPGEPFPRLRLPGQGQKGKAAEREGAMMAIPAQEVSQEPVPSWEQKPVAVLAIEVTWPVVTAPEAQRYEPWTLATHWEQVIAQKVQGFGGIVIQHTPSLYLVAFGLPQTLEQLPQRAVQVALALRRVVAEAGTAGASAPSPAVRQAVHWGLLLVDAQARDPTARLLASGETLALPVRLLGQAAPGEILVSAQMAGLVERWYELQVCGGAVEAGSSERLGAYRVVGLRPQSSSLAQYDVRPLSRFVGRDQEMAILHALLAQVEDGQGHIVGIVGDPGIGKSRLLDEFRRRLTGRRLTYLRGRCLSYGSATPYFPVLDLLRHHCGLTEVESPEAISAKVHRILQEVGMTPDEWAPYLLPLLGLEAGTDQLTRLSPQAIKARTFETLIQMSLNGSWQRPLVLEVEDLHWIDATSEEWLTALVERVAGVPILVLVSYRPGYRPRWVDKSYATQLTLRRLTPRDSLQVLRAVLHSERIPAGLAQAIVARADGNPFFLEELARTVVEQGDRRPPLAVPDTIHAVLAARIDRLPPAEKRLLQAAAVVGKDIALPLLQALVGLSEEDLRRGLRFLQAAEFFYETHLLPEPIYTFKHVLTQEVAYQSLLQRTRQQYHRQIAELVEERLPEIAATQPEWVAQHYTAAGLMSQAIPYWRRAGRRALQRSAYVEAISHLTQGLKVLKTLPETPERAQQELDLQTSLGLVLMATRGYAAAEVEQVYARMRELCQQIGDTPQLFPRLRGVWEFYLMRGEFQTVLALGKQSLAWAQRQQDPAFLLGAHSSLGITLFYLGELVLAREHLEHGMALHAAPQQHRSHAFFSKQESDLTGLAHLAVTLWLLGYPDQARQRSQELLTLLRELSHPFRLTNALAIAAMLDYYLREEKAVQERAEVMIALCTEYGFPRWLAGGTMLQGWALAAQGQEEAGIAQMRQGLAAWRATGLRLGRPCWLYLLAEACGNAGQVAAGLRVLDEALAAVHKSGEHRWEAELYRLKGELLLRLPVGADLKHGALDEAETCFRQALDIAQRQQAKALELQAVMRLSRLWQRQGQRNDARQLLAPIYGWFSEGFDTADLQEAKALLEELS
jgi:DNA-binding NtrC family response regulator/predicted ATPase